MKIAFFGTGLMGSGFVRRLRANGHEVNVWNRSAAKARKLEADGARAFDDPAAALAGAERLHLSLSDDASVDAVLEPLAAAIPAGTWIVDHTTTAVRPTAERVARWEARGRTFVHAPVFMGPANAAEGTGLMLVSGAQARHDALLPELKKMTGQVVYLGEDPSRAAAFKLFGNMTLDRHPRRARRRQPAGACAGHPHRRGLLAVQALQPGPDPAGARGAHRIGRRRRTVLRDSRWRARTCG